jgi:hypothetical protein
MRAKRVMSANLPRNRTEENRYPVDAFLVQGIETWGKPRSIGGAIGLPGSMLRIKVSGYRRLRVILSSVRSLNYLGLDLGTSPELCDKATNPGDVVDPCVTAAGAPGPGSALSVGIAAEGWAL